MFFFKSLLMLTMHYLKINGSCGDFFDKTVNGEDRCLIYYEEKRHPPCSVRMMEKKDNIWIFFFVREKNDYIKT